MPESQRPNSPSEWGRIARAVRRISLAGWDCSHCSDIHNLCVKRTAFARRGPVCMHPRVFPPAFLSCIRPTVLMDLVLTYEAGWEGQAVRECNFTAQKAVQSRRIGRQAYKTSAQFSYSGQLCLGWTVNELNQQSRKQRKAWERALGKCW